jgi:excisionase family DNA binding protein
MSPPVRPSGGRSGGRLRSEETRRPLCAPTAPSGGRLWHGFAVRRPLLGGGGEALTFGRPDVHREPLGGHPIHITLSPAVQDVATKSEGRTFFTERTLAAYLAVSDRTIRNWIRRGELPSYKLGASRRIDPADVETFLARHRDQAA